MTLNVGLTGNVAAGKSTVSAMLAQLGATVIDADVIVRELQAPGTPLTKQIGETFGPNALLEDGSLDRNWLRRKMLENPQHRETLNGLVHPAVQRRRLEETDMASRRGEDLVINDIPLLFEVLDAKEFDVIVLVDASEEIRLARLVERGLQAPQARALMAAQMDPELKRDRSDFIIDNNGTMAELRAQTEALWQGLKKRAATLRDDPISS